MNGNKQRFWSIDDFEVGAVIGEGRFGKVFVAKEKKSKFLCVLKILQKAQLKKYKLESQVISEIEIHSKFRHKNIVRLYGYFFDQERIMMILEYAARGTLADHLAKSGPFNEQTASKYFKQIVSAIENVHSHDVIHRDLKPSNILISLENTLLLSDFGFAISGRAPEKSFVGTLDYIAPEILNGKSYGKEADIWSLGVILYELVSGKTPFEEEDERNTVKRIIAGNYQFPSSFSPLLKHLLTKIFNLNPQERPTASQILEHPWLTLEIENSI